MPPLVVALIPALVGIGSSFFGNNKIMELLNIATGLAFKYGVGSPQLTILNAEIQRMVDEGRPVSDDEWNDLYSKLAANDAELAALAEKAKQFLAARNS